MRKFTFKSLLITAMLCLGTSAWAEEGDVTTNANIDFSNAIESQSVAGTVSSMTWTNQWSPVPSITDGRFVVGNFSGGVVPFEGTVGTRDVVTASFKLAFGKLTGKYIGFNFQDADGNVVAEFEFIPYTSALNKNSFGIETADLYYGNNTVIWDRHVAFTITFDYANKTITTNTSCYKSGTSKAATIATHTVAMSNTTPVAKFVLTSNYNNPDRLCQFDDLLIQTTEGNYDVTTADYKVKYVCEGTTLKEETRSGVVGESISLLASDSQPYWDEDVKYIYVSNDSEGKSVSNDGTTEITVNFRKAETWNYTVKSSVGNYKVTGEAIEGENVSVAFPRLINVDGTIYTSNTANNKECLYTLNMDAADKVATIDFTATDITGVVFFSEAENIEGLTADNGGQAGSRSSMKQGAYATEDTEITTLQSGKYKISGARSGNTGVTFAFVVNGATVSQATTSGSWGTFDGAEFNLIEESTIVLKAAGQAGNNSRTLDYIYIQKTDDATTAPQSVTVGSNGIATYTPSVALDFTNATKIKAYTASVSEAKVILTETKTVAAGEGVIIKSVSGGEETEDFTVVNPVAATEGNALVGTLVDIDALATDVTKDEAVVAKNYILNNGTQGIGFYQAAGKKVAAGKAYLQVPVETAAEAKALTIVWNDGETTGINSVETVEIENGNVYDLSGRKVANPAKGLYIKNGKKFIVK
ncbi:MAG: hypothetical protein IKA00_04880 [Prevotella sp.]|nr:hypothetical protein [Prevotella sp.]